MRAIVRHSCYCPAWSGWPCWHAFAGMTPRFFCDFLECRHKAAFVDFKTAMYRKINCVLKLSRKSEFQKMR
ncbi:SWIM zinc finger family protein [Desulfomicrobium macestii]|uniref:SWIM zinc finger family protein n=1 Tax=Desulfomicrobium macestii TaxID=90731 RepID=UPI00178B88A5